MPSRNMRFTVFSLAAAFLATSVLLVCASASSPARRPHVVVFLIDDLGWTDVGYRNGSEMRTPTLDALASDGILMQRYYTQPVCSPSRSALMQGRYPFRTGMQHYSTIKPASTAHMPLDQPTLAELMREAGYRTHHVGKWHLGYASFNYTPTARGFESHVGYYQGMEDYYNRTFKVPAEYISQAIDIEGYDWWANRSVAREPNTAYNLDLMVQESERVLDQYAASGAATRDQPLFLYYAHQVAHVPIESPPAKYTERCTHISDETRRTYCAMTAALDQSLNEFIDMLKDRQLWDDTLLIVSTDNGGDPNYGSFPASAGCNWPLRAGKGRLFEGGVRSIGFVNGGSNVIPSSRRGTEIDGLAHMVDWFPTILEVAQSTHLAPSNLDGVSLLSPLMKGTPTGRSNIPLDINKKVDFPDRGSQASVLTDDGWKLILDQVRGGTLVYDGYYPCSQSGMIAANISSTGQYLFNVLDDPNEHVNLFNEQPEQVARLQQLLDGYLKDYSNPQYNMFK
eukprot:CAMPEP_0174237238 /NCGR_PEP_ID=MMETSP0417-20130205/7401_1 /TAXON_ID=242541 /ORGANISM="Mayorella sp, Strain BSH-02190019" /LENGTH=509 /DNA_ID=CAMNT_0015315967 /DNA_START=1 /DNA_END=1527 /DNA_ORIENTATION=+